MYERGCIVYMFEQWLFFFKLRVIIYNQFPRIWGTFHNNKRKWSKSKTNRLVGEFRFRCIFQVKSCKSDANFAIGPEFDKLPDVVIDV